MGVATVRYRDAWGNAGLAAACAGVACVFGASAALGDGSQGPVVRWRGGIVAVVLVGLFVVRCLVRGVVVDGDGVTRRTPWTTLFVPWVDVVDTEFRTANDAIFTLDDGRRVRVGVTARDHQPTLRSTYLSVREQWSLLDGWGEPYSTPVAPWFTLGFIVSSIAVILGGVVWDDARFDAAHYAERARSEVAGRARVVRVEVEERHHEDTGSTFTTHVEARVQVPGRRSVVVDLDRSGDVADRYHDGDEVAVVYDSANPLDADFSDRPHRRGDDASVEVRTTTGTALFWLGLVGAIGCGGVIALLRYRTSPTGTRRRSARSLR